MISVVPYHECSRVLSGVQKELGCTGLYVYRSFAVVILADALV